MTVSPMARLYLKKLSSTAQGTVHDEQTQQLREVMSWAHGIKEQVDGDYHRAETSLQAMAAERDAAAAGVPPPSTPNQPTRLAALYELVC